MKKNFILLVAIFISTIAFSQQTANDYIREAQEFISKKNFKEAQTSLQMAINDLYHSIGKEVVAIIPKEIDGLKADPANDVINMGGMSSLGGGFTISREFIQGETQSAKLTIVGNSPLSASINMMLSNPILTNQNNGQKLIRLGNYKGMLEFHSEDKTGNLNIPIGNSLITLELDDFKDEAAIVSFANKLGFDNIKKTLGEF